MLKPNSSEYRISRISLGDDGLEPTIDDVRLKNLLTSGIQDVSAVVLFSNAARINLDIGSLVNQAYDGLGCRGVFVL